MLTSATEAEFNAFLATHGYTVSSGVPPLLALSLAFMNALSWCNPEQEDTEQTKIAQLFIAYAMSAEGGGFNPAARAESLVTRSESVGSLKEEFMFNDSVDLGTTTVSLIKSLPIPYGLLHPLLCDIQEITADNHRASVYVV